MLGPAPDTAPTPWRVEGIGGVHMDGTRDAYVVVDAAGRHICRPCTDLSDARLIAAAPDLLEAAKEALSAIKWLCSQCEESYDAECFDPDCTVHESVACIEAAIAKAEGRAEG